MLDKSASISVQEQLQNSIERLIQILEELDSEDKAQFMNDASNSFKVNLDLDLSSELLFPGIEQLIESGKKKRWKPSQLVITINSYESKDIRRVLGRLNTFAKKNDFELEKLNVGYDNPDSYHEISMRLRNQWHEYKLIFENYIDEQRLMKFLGQFPEIKLGGKSY